MTRLFLVSYRTLAILGCLGFAASVAWAALLWRMDFIYRADTRRHT